MLRRVFYKLSVVPFVGILTLYVIMLSGCGVVADGVNHARTVQFAPGPLYSAEFYRTATPEEVKAAIGGRSLADECYTEKVFAKDTGGIFADLKKIHGVFVPASSVAERSPLYPLEVALWNTPHPEVITVLLHAGAPANTASMAHYVTWDGANPEIAAILMERASEYDRCRILTIYAENGNRAQLDTFLARPGFTPECSAYSNFPLAAAIRKNHNDIAEYLIARGANVNHDEEDRGPRAVHAALASGNAEGFRLLLRKGAKTDYRAPNGMNRLIHAARQGQINDKDILAHLGETVPVDDANGSAAIADAAKTGDITLLQRLIDRGARRTGTARLLLSSNTPNREAVMKVLQKNGIAVKAL